LRIEEVQLHLIDRWSDTKVGSVGQIGQSADVEAV
jgi:hypothetical protein